MTKLRYTFKNDILFKMIFIKYPSLLKRLVSEMLGIPLGSIEQFEINNTEMPPGLAKGGRIGSYTQNQSKIPLFKSEMLTAVNIFDDGSGIFD